MIWPLRIIPFLPFSPLSGWGVPAGVWVWAKGERREHLQSAHLYSQQVWPIVYQEEPAGVRGWNTGTKWGGERLGGEGVWDREQPVFCCRTRDKVGELNLKERWEWWGSSVDLALSLVCLAAMFSLNACWYWKLGIIGWVWGRKVEGGELCILLKMESGKEDHSRFPATELGWDWVGALDLRSNRWSVVLPSA